MARLALVVAGVAVSAAVLLAIGTVVLTESLVSPGAESLQEGRRAQSDEEYVACSRLVVEGVVTGVRSIGRTDRVAVRVRVATWFKPAAGPLYVRFTSGSPQSVGARPWTVGSRFLVVVPQDRSRSADVLRGRRIRVDRPTIRYAAENVGDTTCPQLHRDHG